MQKLIHHFLYLHLSSPHLSNIRRNVYRLFTRPTVQHLKAEQLDRKTLQIVVLQLENDFALLRYLLFSSVGTICNKDFAVKNSATSPSINPNPTSSAILLPCAAEPSVRRSTPVGAVAPAGAKTKISANADFQRTPSTQEAPPITAQNPTSRISKLKKLFADEIATYTSITAGIHSQYFFLCDKIRQLEAGKSDAIIWIIPSVKFVFDSAKVARPYLTPSLKRPQVLVVPSSGLIPMDTTFSSNSTLMLLDPQLASVHQSYSPSSLVTTTICFNGPSRRSLTLLSVINWIHWTHRRKQFRLIKTRPTRNRQSQQKQESRQSSSKILFITLLFSETEGFLIDGASFMKIKFSDPPVLKSHTQTSLLFLFPWSPSINFTSLLAGWVIALHITLKRWIIETWVIN